MIAEWAGSAKRIGYAEVFADATSSRIFYFTMPGNGAGALRVAIVVDTVFATFPQEHAAVVF